MRFKDNIINMMEDNKVCEMKNYIQHGSTTTYDHCISVTMMCEKIVTKLNVDIDEDSLYKSALLHDFFLYDWHETTLKDLHGYKHAKRAAKNAELYFQVSKKVKENIQSHMWSLNLFSFPKTKEAWILCFADKIISVKEVLLPQPRVVGLGLLPIA